MKGIQRIKIALKLGLRYLSDLRHSFARREVQREEMSFVLKLSLEIKPSDTYEQKVYNLIKASERISLCLMRPGEIFSFWKMVGSPYRGYKRSRSLVHGKLKEELGGGLCQVSGMIYYMSLLAGLKTLERHNHSVDIYTDETRYAPLGTDATVVYGYKDLRIRNTFDFPIQFRLAVEQNYLVMTLCSSKEIKLRQLLFDKVEERDQVCVHVKDAEEMVLNTSRYRKLFP